MYKHPIFVQSIIFIFAIFCVIQQWEGLIELLGSESKNTGGLEFLQKYVSFHCFFFPFIFLSYRWWTWMNRYRDFKKSLHQVHQKGKTTGVAQSAVDSLIAVFLVFPL